MMNYTVYVVDDEASITQGIKLALEDQYRIHDFADAEKAIVAIERNPPDLVLLDIGLPGINGVDALGEIKARFPDMLVIMITAYEDVDTVIAAMKLGAYDYVIKPLHMDGLEISIRNALDTIKLRKEVQGFQAKYLKENLPCFIGESRAIVDVMEFIEAVAQSPDTPILLIGETGTGKELIASSIHYRSPNFQGPLATVNCAAIPRELLESELFGYEKGAFSGAKSTGKNGLVEEAANGTLFLDEVGDLNLEAQAKLLRFLETGEFYRIGGTKKLQVKTRVVSATNKNIEEMIEQRLFRKDLFFRLGVIRVEIPSLNERREDIVPMAKHFLYEYKCKFNKDIKCMSPETEKMLLEYKWTGNVRELKNMIERGVLTAKGPELQPRDLGIESGPPVASPGASGFPLHLPPVTEAGVDLSELERAIEKYYLDEAYKLTKGNESQAAKLLNLNHHTYRYRRKKLLDD
jgi:DNA-binding NtrC family response regulator